MKITPHATLADLEVELTLLGSPTLTVTISQHENRAIALYHNELGLVFGHGATLWEAIDMGIVELRQRIAEDLASPMPRVALKRMTKDTPP